MTHVIAVVGGKGGTGKTFTAVNLAFLLRQRGSKVLLIDADVENPSVQSMINVDINDIVVSKNFKPIINESKCLKCGLCVEKCPENALILLPAKKLIHVESLCSGCGVCKLVCPVNAIEAGERVDGFFKYGSADGIDVVIGELSPGSRRNITLIIKLVEEHRSLFKDYNYVVIDSPPGSHAGLYSIIRYSSHIVVVTEPTPLGVNDLEKLLALIDKLKLYRDRRIIAVINKYGLPGDSYKRLKKIIEERKIPYIKIPYSDLVPKAYASNTPLVKLYPNSSIATGLRKLVELIL